MNLRLVIDTSIARAAGFSKNSRDCTSFLEMVRDKEFYLVTKFGEHKLTNYKDDIYSTQLPFPNLKVNDIKFISKPELFKNDGFFNYINIEGKKFTYLEPIEPHLVINEDLNDDKLLDLGKKINAKKDIFPLGININAYHISNDNTLHVKTYERGVKRLTCSCGTGSLSCSTHFLNGKNGVIKVLTPGGDLDISIWK